MRTRHWIAAAIATLGIAAAAPTGQASTSTPSPIATAAKSCSAGFTHGVIGGAEKCLRAGEFCAAGHASQYPRYGFRCVGGRLH